MTGRNSILISDDRDDILKTLEILNATYRHSDSYFVKLVKNELSEAEYEYTLVSSSFYDQFLKVLNTILRVGRIGGNYVSSNL